MSDLAAEISEISKPIGLGDMPISEIPFFGKLRFFGG